MERDEGYPVEGGPLGLELIQSACEFVPLVPDDGDELVNLKGRNGLLVSLAPEDGSFGVAVPPHPQGRKVPSPLKGLP